MLNLTAISEHLSHKYPSTHNFKFRMNLIYSILDCGRKLQHLELTRAQGEHANPAKNGHGQRARGGKQLPFLSLSQDCHSSEHESSSRL